MNRLRANWQRNTTLRQNAPIPTAVNVVNVVNVKTAEALTLLLLVVPRPKSSSRHCHDVQRFLPLNQLRPNWGPNTVRLPNPHRKR
jgi:hypothetical protein